MCFTINPKHKTSRIAKRNIACYKVGIRVKSSFHSSIMNHYYYANELVKSSFTYDRYGYTTIEEGLHSFTNFEKAKRCCRYSRRAADIARFTIPKGARYYYNPDSQEFVSNKIIFNHFVNGRGEKL